MRKIIFSVLLAGLVLSVGCALKTVVPAEKQTPKVECQKSLPECVGKVTQVEGQLSNIMWQHIWDTTEPYTEVNYLDLPSGQQIIVYTREEISLPFNVSVKFIGKVKEVRASGEPGTKIDDENYVEYQLLADTWEVVK